MNDTTLLLRQIHPNFVQDGRVTSQAFRPTPKDQHCLSVDNGDRVDAESAWRRFTSNPNCTSVGVLAVTRADCETQKLNVIEDGEPYPEHCSIDFSTCSNNNTTIKRISKYLCEQATMRGWLWEVTA
ncbi:MAG: hypothetical protein ACRC46_03135 [Thermoguttaceae bacterium]